MLPLSLSWYWNRVKVPFVRRAGFHHLSGGALTTAAEPAAAAPPAALASSTSAAATAASRDIRSMLGYGGRRRPATRGVGGQVSVVPLHGGHPPKQSRVRFAASCRRGTGLLCGVGDARAGGGCCDMGLASGRQSSREASPSEPLLRRGKLSTHTHTITYRQSMCSGEKCIGLPAALGPVGPNRLPPAGASLAPCRARYDCIRAQIGKSCLKASVHYADVCTAGTIIPLRPQTGHGAAPSAFCPGNLNKGPSASGKY